MKILSISTALLATVAAMMLPAFAHQDDDDERGWRDFTLAFYGDAPCAIETGVGVQITGCADDGCDSHPYYPGGLPNFHRLAVHGSTFPLEYTRLTVNPRGNRATTASSFGPFSWERVIP